MTKKLNKKGTSLVELIAVIVIMGIIAAIAVPTTISVINAQKKKATVASATSVVTALKNRAMVEADATTVKVTAMVNATATTGLDATIKYAMKIEIDSDGAIYESLGVDSLDMTGTLLVTFTTASGIYSYTPTDFKVDGSTISVNTTTGVCAIS